MVAKKKASLQSLKAGRPPTAKSGRSMSRKASRTLINTHHQLEKRRRQATAMGDGQAEAAIAAEIASLGGLDHYQQASLQGQRLDRGGDTSKVLLEWLPTKKLATGRQRLRMLEVGALSTRNACSRSGLFDMVRIDLNSQEKGIVEQDFMERPLPSSDADKFDVISLSLVLNFVPEAESRGQMLMRTLSFLRKQVMATQDQVPFPLLFLVLPRSCLSNSRYMTESRLEELMSDLGYRRSQTKMTQKLAYSLWRNTQLLTPTEIAFTKREVNPGRARNNFVITLHHRGDR
ncbi:25S rRNA (adenine(2142)-N(1))-methyltransferase [Purpureocillium takamizusanense]|uniref:25S rRNA adenine-N(1) methyltransferase n=1 Tax=Purpureocillium takamizusanense TaxID=2060973 RepID=A0A9Q8QBL6_9HYPO|nr:25S rRNA (adenine(2142)-N(1))-methyltransferase [Purpureocillium takamizusanense]UNI16272.1 25S rRNA (adenine(2142)-N(1))-methyltransferase [Purpureocillium takamizusanense]